MLVWVALSPGSQVLVLDLDPAPGSQVLVLDLDPAPGSQVLVLDLDPAPGSQVLVLFLTLRPARMCWYCQWILTLRPARRCTDKGLSNCTPSRWRWMSTQLEMAFVVPEACPTHSM
jgi:hypothetical protein